MGHWLEGTAWRTRCQPFRDARSGWLGLVIRTCLKRVIFTLAVRRLIPTWVADHMIQSWGLADA